MRLVDLLREYGLERSLKTLLANVRIKFSFNSSTIYMFHIGY
jgi:hypothetical protein